MTLEAISVWKDSARGTIVYQVSFLDFFLFRNSFLYSYFLINCYVYIFNLLLSLIGHLIYSHIILFSL